MSIKLKEVLNREIKNRGESINSLARACNISPSVLHGWVQGTVPNAKNLHHIKSLSDYLKIPIATLLFNVRDQEDENDILFSSTFVDGDRKYRLLVEKLSK